MPRDILAWILPVRQLAASRVLPRRSPGHSFRGSEPLPFGSAIRPVRELMEYLLTGAMPAGAPG